MLDAANRSCDLALNHIKQEVDSVRGGRQSCYESLTVDSISTLSRSYFFLYSFCILTILFLNNVSEIGSRFKKNLKLFERLSCNKV